MTKSTYTTIKVGKQRLITMPQNAAAEYQRIENLDGSILLVPVKAPEPGIVPIAVPVLEERKTETVK